ncbi:MAG: CHC2 zinc finger domain-containing protein [Enterobacteriaceae bacterium]
MVKLISKTFIKNLLKTTDIVYLINSIVPLKKKGRNFYAKCPFHNEKNPSFVVSKEKQCYHCFGCNVHGNSINFLMQYNKISFIEAIKEIANTFNIKIPYNKSTKNILSNQKNKEKTYKIMYSLSKFYNKCLNKDIFLYLKKRGINEKTTKKFFIGFSPRNSFNLIKKKKYLNKNINHLINLGILVKNKYGSFFDIFNNRIIFPINDNLGNIVAFGGRVINDKNYPKYLNSP